MQGAKSKVSLTARPLLSVAPTYLVAEVVASSDAALIGKTPVQIPTLTASLGLHYDDGEACWTDLVPYGGDHIGDERRVDDDQDGSAVQDLCHERMAADEIADQRRSIWPTISDTKIRGSISAIDDWAV